MTGWDWTTLIAGIILAGILTGFLLRLYTAKKHILIIPEYKKTHKRTEARLLNYILDDMRNNPQEWIATPYDIGSQREASYINDKKNIAVMVSSSSKNYLVIKMNLTAAHKYMDHAEDTVATPITGDHVTKFLSKVEECIDTRGKELSFIENMLKEKL